MNKISVLDEKTAGQIAAGEVIERPAGVLKELLENAIDAGATSVHITIEGAGRTLIRINDNGQGMSKDDLSACVLRHATSKIRTFEDLGTLQTFGFRGEALYSIAAVSRMTLTSCQEGGNGHRIELEGGKIIAQSPAPAIVGTTVEIRDLFYNVPARLKFLKSDSYERACLLKVVEESALANLTVGFHVTVNGREVYNLPAQNEAFEMAVKNRAKAIFGTEVAQSLVSRSWQEKGFSLFITPADKLVTVRDYQFVFINRRPIDSKTVQQAIYKAYQNARPKDRHPAFLVYWTLPPADFDVNIHPQKRDIRFAAEHEVFNFLLQAAGETIFSNGHAVEVRPSVSAPQVELPESTAIPQEMPTIEKKTPRQIFAETFGYLAAVPQGNTARTTVGSLPEKKADFFVKPSEGLRETDTWTSHEDPIKTQESVLPAFSSQTAQWYQGPYHYLGQLQRSYLLFENPQGLVLIDQHAAQERVLFERYLDAFENHTLEVQKLLFPIHVDLMPSGVETLLSWADFLKSAGFEIEKFSARTVLVRTMPHIIRFKEDEMKGFIVLLSQLTDDVSKATDDLKRKMIAMLACKRAIKAHDAISASEAETLLENMKNCKDGMHCPHGRPVLAQLDIQEIGKLFGR
ncbi:MAG: DNA mismatch repair endonuclease MutL [Elusimicrobiaceae bacterium]|nr:DNA mismatch repair endonuclease MutL [Elusimicrobiaceae bacterium]